MTQKKPKIKELEERLKDVESDFYTHRGNASHNMIGYSNEKHPSFGKEFSFMTVRFFLFCCTIASLLFIVWFFTVYSNPQIIASGPSINPCQACELLPDEMHPNGCGWEETYPEICSDIAITYTDSKEECFEAADEISNSIKIFKEKVKGEDPKYSDCHFHNYREEVKNRTGNIIEVQTECEILCEYSCGEIEKSCPYKGELLGVSG